MPTVVITGAAGFLGSHLSDAFIRRGWRVIGLDNLITGSDANVAHLSGEANFELRHQDVSAFISVDEPVDAILHFASPASPPDYLEHPIKTMKVGALGTHNCLGLARAKGARFLLASTSEVYGDPLVHPQTEDYWGNVNPVGPRAVYDEAKRFAEALTMAYRKQHRVDTRIIRIFNTYGPRMRLNDGRVVPNFLHQLLSGKPLTVYGDGSQTRSFCYVADLVAGIQTVLEKGDDQPYNLGNPTEMTIKELAEAMSVQFQGAGEIVYTDLPTDDPKVRCPNIGRARSLGWAPKVDFAEGIQRTFAYFQERWDADLGAAAP